MSRYGGDRDEEFSVISEEQEEIGFLDFKDNEVVNGYDISFECPIIISNPFQLHRGKPQSATVGEVCTDVFTLENPTNEPVELWSVKIFASNPKDSFILSLMKPPTPDSSQEERDDFLGLTALGDRVLQPGQTLKIWLSCTPKEIGMFTSVVHFDVNDERIERVAFLLAEDSVSQALASNKPYIAASRKNGFHVDRYVPGSRPQKQSTRRKYVFRLHQYQIPDKIREMVEFEEIPPVLFDWISPKNYAEFFSTLLVMEEIHLEKEMLGYSMEEVSMKRRGTNFLSLVVPGLAEKRPSLVTGDFIFVKLSNKTIDDFYHPYQGYIHRVEADEIFLKFEREMHSIHQDNHLYDVRFSYNRLNMRRLYQAVHTAENLGPHILFPSEFLRPRKIKNVPFTPLSSNINKEQIFAVEKILGCYGVPPYIIHGPPGTGKTMTLVEAILQIYMRVKNAKILICAPSNNAADHILERIISWDGTIQGSRVFRLNAVSRSYDDVRSDFLQFCFFDEMVFACPPLEALVRYNIIVSTYMGAAQLYSSGIQKNHFTHIFLDEAGQASEPDTMVSLANLCCKNTVVVLAGDPMQLGPVVFSRNAQHYGLGKSYLERLFETEYYSNRDENYIMKLIRNYRSHLAILDLPSRLFYNGELIACKEDNDQSIYESLNFPNKNFPILFVGIQGCDEREGNNPSWFNRIEASKVVELIGKIKRNTDLTESDIGVITPYRQQVFKIMKALDTIDMPDVKVGSVEQFQGQERTAIIISMVRSTIKHNNFDQTFNLGFLSNPRRFNVAITRAKSLLIIVGNPHIIMQDHNWNKLLKLCVDNGSYQGCDTPPELLKKSEDLSSADTQWGNYTGSPSDVPWDDYIPQQGASDSQWDDYIPEEGILKSNSQWDDYDPQQGASESKSQWDSEYVPEQDNQYNGAKSGEEETAQGYKNDPYTNDVKWE